MPFDAAPISRITTDCLLCPVKGCMGRRNGGAHTGAWAEILAPRVAVMPGTAGLFRAGDRQQAVYSVRGGCLKTFTVDADGNERIRGFFLPGDIVGLDSLGGGIHLSSAAAVAPSQVCIAPLPALRRMLSQQPELAQRLLEQTSHDLALALTLSGAYTAEQRMAAFLLHIRKRLDAAAVLRLPMGQREIGSYLRLATETVCRTLKGFERRGWLSLGPHAIRLLNEHSLAELAAPVGIIGRQADMAQAA